ncbi:hypothetical protein EUGRSUZ_L01497 [Eucalyptus grandis]|uniref:non-specific serine/threonine protein kinase n=1 Tax=Eucalyptus grandis TaxID=71139 RepID=A0A058ZU34_EUCGR|nr:hypothetical protein EUGRSUZ_L01497 [Eucalyptus grandis]
MGNTATLLLSSPSCSILVFILIGLIIPQVLLCEGDDNVHYTECRHSFNCGTVSNITYPFWGGSRPQFCGLPAFRVECYEDKFPIFEYQEQKYRVLKIDQHLRTMTITRIDLMEGTCLHEFRTTSIMDSTLFHMTPVVKSLNIFYGCLDTMKNISNEFKCFYDVVRKSAFFIDDIFLDRGLCPVLWSALNDVGRRDISLQEALNQGFDVQYSDHPECPTCTSHGFCGSNTSSSSSSFTCYCRDKPHPRTCNDPVQMNLQSFICGAWCCRLALLVIFTSLVYQALSEDKQNEACLPRNCTNGPNISYPFWISGEQESYCGYPNFEITCKEDYPVLNFSDSEFIIKDIFYANHSFLLVNALEYQDCSCGAPPHNISLERTPFNLMDCASNYTHYSFALFFEEAFQETDLYSAVSTCDSAVSVPVDVNANISGVLLMIGGFYIYRSRQRKKYGQSSFALRSISSNYSSRTDFEMGLHGLPIFDYEELKKATNDFDPAAELGDGGFGTVFKGKLRDGRVVAVKRLYESNYKRVEQFMNEVEILTRLRHPNLVSLYGCTSRQSRRLLLVYEYVPNGTVADHIHGDLAKPGLPSWSTRLNIAIETANALVYLHASDVIHRDVKTNNILLDENFSVKVADFGLSRLFPWNATHVSTVPQGTPGYIDPEYHQCYQLTEKSDVYSFGVVLMELISSLPAVDITRHCHEINLSALTINKIQSHAMHELVDQNLGFDTDYRTGEMITAVAELGFQCLEQGHEMRPSMEEVLKTLKEIQNRGDNMEKSDQPDNISDDAVLLKNNPLTSSPVSVTAKWVSNDSTPNASG